MLICNGLATIIGNSGRNLTLIRAESPEEIHRLLTLKSAETVIINPGLVQGNARFISSLRSLIPGARIIALVYALFDDTLLSLFDDRITINDPPERIIEAVSGGLPVNGRTVPDQPNASLSDREIEVLKLLASGLSTKEIGEELHISTNTVITHRKNLSVKTGIKSVSGLAIYAVVKKYIKPDDIGS